MLDGLMNLDQVLDLVHHSYNSEDFKQVNMNRPEVIKAFIDVDFWKVQNKATSKMLKNNFIPQLTEQMSEDQAMLQQWDLKACIERAQCIFGEIEKQTVEVQQDYSGNTSKISSLSANVSRVSQFHKPYATTAPGRQYSQLFSKGRDFDRSHLVADSKAMSHRPS